MTSKVQSAADYWTTDVKMTSKVQPAADYWIIDVKDYWTIDRENLGTRLCHSTKREMAARKVYKFERRKYFEWIIKQLLNSAFVRYEEFCRSRRVLSTSASVDNTLHDPQNSSYPTQPHSIITNYTLHRQKRKNSAHYNLSNIFARARLVWKRHVGEYSPAKTGKYPRIFPNFQNCVCCE